MDFCCALCHRPLETPTPTTIGAIRCAGCGLEHRRGPRSLSYDFDALLLERFPANYVVWKVLCQNGELAYRADPSGSLSLPDRPIVRAFRRFLEAHMKRGRLLDAGCGSLPLPGYLAFEDPRGVEIVGLDPMDNPDFRGERIRGCTEFVPLPDRSVDTVVFATSFDHSCRPDETLIEVRRLLADDGRVVVWTGDLSKPWRARAREWLDNLRHWWRRGYRPDRWFRPAPGIVIHTPPGAVDPYHTFRESPRIVNRIFARAGFERLAFERGDGSGFLAFSKTGGHGR